MDEDNKFLPKLSQNLLEILENDDEYYDITIEIGNDPYAKIFRAHMNILNYRSSYFQEILSSNANNNKKKNLIHHIKLPNILPEIFQIILRYIYGGKLSLKEYDDPSVIIKILIVANELKLQELIDYLQTFLLKNQTNWMEQNFNLIYKTSFENNSFLEFQNYCTHIISKEPIKIFKSSNFSSISEKLLISLIKNDNDHKISEIQVWEYVLKWGIAQNSNLPSDSTSFSKDNFNTLSNTLQQFIPLIKFFNLTPKEFLSKVYPYKKVIPKELREKLVKHFLDYDKSNCGEFKEIKEIREIREIREISPKNIDSKIITFQHSELISKWIDKLKIQDEMKNSYEFKLILGGSLDGFTYKKFHEICDNKFHTVSIIKLKDSNEILGGYNPITWKSDYRYGNTKDSFIFSFKNNDKIENNILSRVRDEKTAIHNNPNYGPSFGISDIILLKNLSYCGISSYEKPIRDTDDYFSVEEYEIFQVSKN